MKSFTQKRYYPHLLLLGILLLFFLVKRTNSVAKQSKQLESKQLLTSSYSCIKETCLLRNVCLTPNLELEYFSTENVNLPIGSLMAARQNYWEKGVVNKLKINFIPPESRKVLYEDPVIVHKMIAMGNFGHALLQNLLPTARMVRDIYGYESLYQGYQVLLLNDCKNCGMPSETCVDGQGSYGYSSCNFQRDQLYPIITGNDLIDAKSLFTDREESVCFNEFVVGMDGADDMLNMPMEDAFLDLKEFTRSQVYSHLRIPSYVQRSDTINVAVYCKMNGRHGGGLTNCDHVPHLVRTIYKNRYKGKKLVVEIINFDMMMDISTQFRIISRANIYIANGGSSSYYTLFLRKGAVSMIVPQCDSCKCFDLFPMARLTPNVTYMPIKSESVTCPTERCMQPEYPDCGAQSFTLLDGFKTEFDEALEIAFKNIYK
jgi:hypothetical protein